MTVGASNDKTSCSKRCPHPGPLLRYPPCGHPQGKKAAFLSAPFAKSAKGGPCTRWMHIFQARAMAAAASRAPSQLARRDALSLTVSAPRLSDFLSNSRSGDAADWQVACGSMLWQRRFVSSLELRRARPADGDTSAVCGPRASAMRPRRVAVGYRPRERSANDARYGCSTVYHHSGCGCESGSARP